MPTSRARVSAIHRDRFQLLLAPEAALSAPPGSHTSATLGPRLRDAADARDRPCIGDWVFVHADAHDGWRIDAIAPRTSLLVRRAAGSDAAAQPLAANVDVALLFASLPDDVNVRRLARLTALAWDGGAMPVIVLSRADLASAEAIAAARVRVARHCPGVPMVAVSAHADDGLSELRPWLAPGKTLVLLGASGAGKSTLVNAIAHDTVARTGAVSANGDGRHTTTGRALYQLDGGVTLIDTPGLREVGLVGDDAQASADGVDRLFADLLTLAESCHFADCRHQMEPRCAVRAAVEDGTLDPERLEQWHELRAELDRSAQTIAERRRVERQGSRMIRQYQQRHAPPKR